MDKPMTVANRLERRPWRSRSRTTPMRSGRTLRRTSAVAAWLALASPLPLIAGSVHSSAYEEHEALLAEAQVGPQSARYQGHHDRTTCEVASGWVWMPDQPDDTVWVDLFDGTRLVASIPAARYREDLSAAGIGTGHHSFRHEFGDSADAPSSIEVRVAGTDVRLRNTPQANPCAPQTAPESAVANPRDDNALGTSLASPQPSEPRGVREDSLPAEAWWARGAFAPDLKRYGGHHDQTTCQVVAGWAWMPDHPADTVWVALFDGDRLIASIPADRYRRDLEEAGIGTGRYGFLHAFPDSADAPAAVEVRVTGTDVRLRNSPQPNPCVLRVSPVGEGQDTREDDRTAARRKVIRPERVEPGSVRVDGRLDEPLWARAAIHTDFQQKGLERGLERPPQTAVAMAYDREALYIAARLQSPDMESLDTRLDRRDEGANADRILVSLDTFRDRRTAYTFGVTGTGVRIDHYHPYDSELPKDDSYDPVWEARTSMDADGWTAEMRIPFSQLRFNADSEMTWGINIRRWNPQELLNLYWVVVPQAESGWASRFGELSGLRGVGSPVRIEVAPYVLAGATVPVGTDSDVARESVSRFGGDAKVGLGSQFTMDVTVNPDFGQVDADPAEVNLSGFETAFPERRPFFVEGARLLQPRGPRYFHSRRIGSVPGLGVPDYFQEVPEAPRIVGAAKLTGRFGSGTAVGGLFARTAETFTHVLNPDTEILDPVVAGPSTNFMVGRVVQEFGEPGSAVGALVTMVRREIAPGSPLATQLVEDAVTGGADWTLRFGEGRYELAGHAGGSMVRGDPVAIAAVQRSNAHYFQRPDATHVLVDESRASLSGYTAGLSLEKLTGRNWMWALRTGLESPGFEIRDMGTFRAADHIDASATLRYRQQTSALFRWFLVTASADAAWNFEGITQYASPSMYFTGEFHNLWRSYVRLGYEASILSDDLTRGGPLMRMPAAREVGAGLLSPFNATQQWSVSGSYRTDDFGGWGYNVDVGLSVRPSPRVGLSLYPGFLRSVHTRQSYGTWPDGRPETYSLRYMFASIDRREAYVQLRMDLPITPDLGVELYLEPFVSTGHYYDFGELAEPRSGDVLLYGEEGSQLTVYEDGSFFAEDDWGGVYVRYPDYTVKSMRSNAVLRWEWLRGSTFHLIWQQNRWSSLSGVESVRPGSLFDTYVPNGNNILTAKLTYRLGVR